jgi:TolB-like protein/Flp pilus assembly protein TadD
MTLSAGSRLGPYEIVAPLGAGGMGEVHRAKDTRLGREVAIKVLPTAFAADPERLRRFELEARSASALNHPNIVTVHDVGEHEGTPYVVLELLEGQTLRERLAAGALGARKAAEYAVQIAYGLAAAHEKGIVHRDLKPDNVFITRDGRAKILDFGLAKTGHETTGASATNAPTEAGTEPGVVMGTIGYMSPEQVRGQPADQRSDLFAFGAMLYEMLTGKRAFAGGSAVETMNAILNAEPPEPSRSQAEVTPALDRIVRRCLEKSPAERFQSAGDLAFALGEASSVASASAVRPPAPGGKSPRLGLTLLAALLLLLAALFAANVGGLRDRFRSGSSTGRIRSLAVLPLENFSRDPEQEYFADGMTEELITNLAQIRSLHVISRMSAMHYKGSKKPLPQIAKELKVDAVLEGSVGRAGNRVRITAQLIDAATDRHLWAKSYERDLKDVLSLQSEVAQAVAREVRAAVTPEERARLERARPVDPEVHELYMKGSQHVSMVVEKELRLAIALFERGLAKDPNDARCWAGLADAWAYLSDFYLPPMEAMPKARDAAERALRLDDSLAEAHTSLGFVYTIYDWKWAEGEKELRRALELNPNYAPAHDRYSWLLAVLGRPPESLRESRLARELDPLSPMIHADAGWAAMVSRQPEEAIPPLKRAIELEPGLGMAHATLSIVYAQKGLRSEALSEARTAQEVDHSPLIMAMSGGAIARAGDLAGARKVLARLEEISKTRYVCPYQVGVICAHLGETDEAFRWLEKAYQVRSQCVPFLKVDPQLDPIRSDPRYADLVRRLAFPP